MLVILILFVPLSSLYYITRNLQKEVDDLNDISKAANYIEVFEYSGHEYLRYKVGNGRQFGGLCHKADCKYCKDFK